MATKLAGNVNSGKEPTKTAIGRGERPSKRSPSPARITKPPSPPTLPGRLSKSPNSEIVKERKPLSVVSRASSSENSKNVKPASTNGASKRTDFFGKPNETSATGLKVRGSEDMSLEKGGDRKSKETPPKSANGLKIAGSEENSEVRRKPTEISPQSTSSGEKGGSGKASPNLCSECKAAAEGAFCFIGNDGRVSACTTRSAVRLCKNIKCPANNPEYVASLIAAPKKYLVSKRHLLKAQFAPKNKSRQPKSPVGDQHTDEISKANQNNAFTAETDLTNDLTPQAGRSEASNEIALEDEASDSKVDQDGVSSPHTSQDGASGNQSFFDGDDSPEYGIHEELGEDVDEDDQSSDDGTEFTIDRGSSSESAGLESSGGTISSGSDNKLSGAQRMRRRSMNIIDKQDPETVILRKQLIKERRQAGEWMLNYAIEEAVQKLAPNGETKVKVLVEAFEKICSHADVEAVDFPDGPKTTSDQPPTNLIHN